MFHLYCKRKVWLNKISHFYKKLFQGIFQQLENEGILIGDFKARRFYLAKPEIKDSLLEQINNVIINNINPGIELLCLLGLMKECALIKVYFLKKYRKDVERRIKELLYSPYYAPETREMIFIVIKAIRDIIRARQAASTVF